MTPNVAASVHQRLLNRAHAMGRPFNELLLYFVLERVLNRLGHSPHFGGRVGLVAPARRGDLARFCVQGAL